MQNELPDMLALRLNFDVIAFRGNTRREMMVISIVSLLSTALIFGTLTHCLFGMFLAGVGLSFPVAIPIGWLLATLMQKLKDGKPKGYVKQRLLLWLDKEGVKKSPFVRHTGSWTVRRFFK